MEAGTEATYLVPWAIAAAVQCDVLGSLVVVLVRIIVYKPSTKKGSHEFQ